MNRFRSVVASVTLSLAASQAGAQSGVLIPLNATQPDASVLSLEQMTVNVTIDVTTVSTGVTQRDNDLKSAKFFDATQFPTATFVSTSVSKSGTGLTVSGNLTLHGVTKPVVLQVDGPTGPVNGMDKKPHAGFSATTTFKRTDFAIAAGYPATVVGDDVALTIDLDVAKQ